MIRATALAALIIALSACVTSGHSTRAAHPDSNTGVSPNGAYSSSAAGNAQSNAHLMIANAETMLGQPYRWSGAAPGGFDCSGLVSYAAAGAGITVPRTAKEQLHAGAAVARKDLAPGDLIFMHLAHKELHVGIVIDNDRFIHAPSAGGRVRIDSLSASPYSHGYIAARRVTVR